MLALFEKKRISAGIIYLKFKYLNRKKYGGKNLIDRDLKRIRHATTAGF